MQPVVSTPYHTIAQGSTTPYSYHATNSPVMITTAAVALACICFYKNSHLFCNIIDAAWLRCPCSMAGACLRLPCRYACQHCQAWVIAIACSVQCMSLPCKAPGLCPSLTESCQCLQVSSKYRIRMQENVISAHVSIHEQTLCLHTPAACCGCSVLLHHVHASTPDRSLQQAGLRVVCSRCALC